MKAFILNENGIDGGPLVINDVPYNPLTFYDNATEQARLSKFWMDVMRAHRDENKLAATCQLRLQHEEAEDEQTIDLHGVYAQVRPIFNIYINMRHNFASTTGHCGARRDYWLCRRKGATSVY